MKRFLCICIAAVMATLPMSSQNTAKPQAKPAAKPVAKPAAKPAASPAAKPQANPAAKPQAKPAAKPKAQQKPQQPKVVATKEIKGLQGQRAAVQSEIRKQEGLLRENTATVQVHLNNLISINSDIAEKQRSLDTISKDLSVIDGNISIIKAQLVNLQEQLDDRRAKYAKAMRYMSRFRGFKDKLLFIFSADSFQQMYRRFRFIREYAAFQRAQAAQLQSKQAQVDLKHSELRGQRGAKHSLLSRERQEQTVLENKKAEQQQEVANLQGKQKEIQGVIDEQKRKNAALNAQIDRLIAAEVAKARARAEAEAKKKAAEQAAAKKRRAEEAARKKAAAEAARKEAERKVAEAKAAEARAKAAAREAARADAARKAAAEKAAREAEAARKAAERKAAAERQRSEREAAAAKKEADAPLQVSSEDRALSSNFEANRGRLPMPITGGYRIVSHYGQYNVEGLKNVTLDNKGINIQGSAGAQARAIFNGEVSSVFSVGGSSVVMVRHGSYISVYCNLRSVSVHTGQKVSTRQTLGTVGADNILQFQLRKETAKLNPEAWLGR